MLLEHVPIHGGHHLAPEFVHFILHPAHLGVEPLPDVVELGVHDGKAVSADGNAVASTLLRR